MCGGGEQSASLPFSLSLSLSLSLHVCVVWDRGCYDEPPLSDFSFNSTLVNVIVLMPVARYFHFGRELPVSVLVFAPVPAEEKMTYQQHGEEANGMRQRKGAARD